MGENPGGEYAAINSAIDELIPARLRGRIDLMVNGSYWLGAAVGAAMTLVLLDTDIFAANVGRRRPPPARSAADAARRPALTPARLPIVPGSRAVFCCLGPPYGGQ